ncbi:YigZ family protein [Streptomyces sp. NPDC004134]|uniref:YigZ family protein n=1 Tax=Streptomyces sp. NPDC004134 TaxID=3364691 RepID=UPI00367673F4
MREGYLTVAREGVHETEVNRSRFVCTLAPAATEAEAQAVLARVRAAYPDASHHCFAYVIGADAGVQKSGDDGEPGGTAGLPMLQLLLRRELRYAVAVVARYFGGTKLGAGGLIRAYGGAVGAAVDALGTVTRLRMRLVTVTVDHGRAGKVLGHLHAAGRDVRGVAYGESVDVEVAVPAGELDDFRSWLADATAGSAELRPGDEVYGSG